MAKDHWRWAWVGFLYLVLVAMGCGVKLDVATDAIISCAEDTECPPDLLCAEQIGLCVRQEVLSACEGVADLEPCSYSEVSDGICFGEICIPAGCGNAIIDPDEVCDDGNRLAGDGCSADCLSNETCGNGTIDAVEGESCDDGNALDGDGCQLDCLLPVCGDGVVDAAFFEQCDLGLDNSNLPDAVCRTNCQPQRCGDGVTDVLADEICDDGNQQAGDGCDSECESTETCGNDIVDIGEQCDDGNTIDADGCQGDCRLARCGDGILDDDDPQFEGCDCGDDDAIVPLPAACNGRNSQAPAATCRVDCELQRCGDGVPDPGEICDDGNADVGDECSHLCQSNETCRNGYVDFIADEHCDDGNPASHDGCSSGCTTEIPTWHRWQNPLAGRYAHSLAYDAGREVVVLFGGFDNDNRELDDTWEHDGVQWHRITTTNRPAPRGHAAMTFDSDRDQMVLYGGYGGGYQDNTWVYDGLDWSARPTSPVPGVGAGPAMAFDPGRGTAVLFGGALSATADTWEFDGNDWSIITTTVAPGVRADARLVYDSGRSRLVLFGGRTGLAFNDTWEFYAGDWHPVTPVTSPTARANMGLVYDASRSAVLLYGGTEAHLDTWLFDGSDWSELTTLAAPTPRTNLAMTYVAVRNRPLIFGGRLGVETFSDSWELDGDTWVETNQTTEPSPRYGAHFAYDSLRRRLVLLSINDSNESETWSFDGQTWAMLGATGPNPAVRNFVMAYDRLRDRVVVFGGATLNSGSGFWVDPVAGTWEFDGMTWSQVSPTASPSPRHNAAGTYDEAGQRVVLFGGMDIGDNLLAETWVYDGSTWTDRTTQLTGSPPERHTHAMTYDPGRQVVIAFGGYGPCSYCTDTWEYDGTGWVATATDPTADKPPGRPGSTDAQLAYHQRRGRSVLFILGETWEYDGAIWEQVTPAISAPQRADGAVGYHPTLGELFLFGGASASGILGETWAYHYAGSHPDEDCATAGDEDGDNLFNCADPDCDDQACGGGLRCVAGICQ